MESKVMQFDFAELIARKPNANQISHCFKKTSRTLTYPDFGSDHQRSA